MKPDRVSEAVALIESAWATRGRALSAAPADQRTMLEESREGLVEAAALCRRIGAERELGRALHKLGHLEDDLNNPTRARELYTQALSIARNRGDSLAVAHEVRHLGDLHRAAGRPADAEACYMEALQLYRSHPEPPTLDYANAIARMARLKEEAGPVDAARTLLAQARDLYRTAGVREGVADCEDRLARLGSNP